MDFSKIDFETLRSGFKESEHKNTDLEVLKAAIRAQLEKLIRLNKTRADFADKFEELIESYNQGSQSIGELFEELLKLSRNLSEEQQRHVRENMTEEELVIFDILDDLVAERSLMQGGFLPRALTCHTRTKRQKIGVATIAPISETAQADWNRLITELHTTYHQPGVRHVIQCSEAALQRLNAHFDQTVDQGNGELADMESCVARWTEQAWHLSVVLHAGLWGKDAHNHTLALETAEAAIAIADWFAGQQKDVLARGLHEARKKSEDRVLDLLDERWERSKLDYITHRDVQRGLNTRDADEARGLLARMETGGVLVSEPLRRPEGGHVERRYRLKTGRNPVPG